jgi:hypothetical protein
VFHFMSMPHFLYPFIRQRTFRLVLPFGYCKSTAVKVECYSVFAILISIALDKYLEVGLLNYMLGYFNILPFISVY